MGNSHKTIVSPDEYKRTIREISGELTPKEDKSKPLIEDDSNILSMIVYLLRMFIINNNNIQDIKFENNIHMNIPRNTISAASSILENIDARKDCVTEGQEATEKFLIKKLKIV